MTIAMGRLYFLVFVSLATFMFMARQTTTFQSASGEPTVIGVTAPATVETPVASFASTVMPPSGNAVVLDRRGDGHFYANVEVNGTPIEMMVDTGASGVALSQDDARRAGIATSIGMSDHVGDGASGAVYGDMVTIERLRFGKVELTGLQGAVLRGGEMSLLGQDVLRGFDKVEIEGDRMVLR